MPTIHATAPDDYPGHNPDSPTLPTTTREEWTWYDQPVLEAGGGLEGQAPAVAPTHWMSQLDEAGVPTTWLAGGPFTHDSSASYSLAGPVVHDNSAGYIELAIRRLDGDPCDLQVAPPAATGRTCRELSGELGTAAVIEFADSEQGPTRLVVAEHGGYTAVVAYSLGFPVTDRATYDPDAIHWSGRGPYENSTDTAPPLDSMPTSLEVQASLAWAQLGSAGR